LVTPNTSPERIKKAAALSSAFLYVVSQSSITGGTGDFSAEQVAYFDRVTRESDNATRMIGFGINSAKTYRTACRHAVGAIIGSGFIRALQEDNIEKSIEEYISGILN